MKSKGNFRVDDIETQSKNHLNIRGKKTARNHGPGAWSWKQKREKAVNADSYLLYPLFFSCYSLSQVASLPELILKSGKPTPMLPGKTSMANVIQPIRELPSSPLLLRAPAPTTVYRSWALPAGRHAQRKLF